MNPAWIRCCCKSERYRHRAYGSVGPQPFGPYGRGGWLRSDDADPATFVGQKWSDASTA